MTAWYTSNTIVDTIVIHISLMTYWYLLILTYIHVISAPQEQDPSNTCQHSHDTCTDTSVIHVSRAVSSSNRRCRGPTWPRLRFPSPRIHVLLQQGLLLLVAQVNLPCQSPGKGWNGLFPDARPHWYCTNTRITHVSACISNVSARYYWTIRDTCIISISVMYQLCITCRYVIHVLQEYHKRISYVLQYPG